MLKKSATAAHTYLVQMLCLSQLLFGGCEGDVVLDYTSFQTLERVITRQRLYVVSVREDVT